MLASSQSTFSSFMDKRRSYSCLLPILLTLMFRVTVLQACTQHVWSSFNDTNAAGASNPFQVSSIDECKQRCIQNQNCTAVDVNINRTPKRCWIHIKRNNTLYGLRGTNHYRLDVRCPVVCDTKCKSRCDDRGAGKCDSDCYTGYYLDTSTYTCRSCSSNCARCSSATVCILCNTGYVVQSDVCAACDAKCTSGCDVRGAGKCDATCISGYYIETNTYTCRSCSSSGWRVFTNSNALGASLPFDVSSVQQCQQNCTQNPFCTAVDVDVNLNPRQCWIHTAANASTTDNLHIQLGTNHYQRVLNRCPACHNKHIEWSIITNVVAQGAPRNYSISTVEECLQICLRNLTCVAVDINDKINPTKCWPHFHPDNLKSSNIFTQNGTVHYQLVDRCLNSSVRPLFGPLAGGTKVTITGPLFNALNVEAVHLDSYQTTADLSASTSDSYVFTTPRVSTRQRHLLIIVTFKGGQKVTMTETFEYRGNPVFLDIQPRQHLVVGGTQANVIGHDMNSVAEPTIVHTVLERRYNDNSDTVIIMPNTRTSLEPCTPIDRSRMVCRMPVVKLPPDFQRKLEDRGEAVDGDFGSGVAAYIGPNGRDRVDVYVGFKLDGVTAHNNISIANSTIKLQYYTKPILDCQSKEFEFEPKKDNFISVKGKYLNRGSRAVDFNITVGIDGKCEVVRLTDRQVDCKPPTNKPTSPADNSVCGDEKVPVQVSIGYAEYRCLCLKYTTTTTTSNLPLIIGLSVGLGLLLIIIIVIIIIIIICWRRRRAAKRPQRTDNNAPAAVASAPNMYDDVWCRQENGMNEQSEITRI